MVDSRPSLVQRLRRCLIPVAALSLILTGVAVTANHDAAAAAVVGTATRIVGGQSGRCLDVPNSSTTNGVQTQLYDCTGAANQSWTYTTTKQLTAYGTKCLDASGRGTTNGTAVIIWDCNGQPNQQWNVNANGTITGVQSGLCLDANAAATTNGTRIILWACNGQSNKIGSYTRSVFEDPGFPDP